MEYPLNIYITAHTLISSLDFGISENLEVIHNYRSGIRVQEVGLTSDHPLLAEMIDSVKLEKRAKLMQITDYTRMERLLTLAIQEVISQSGIGLREPDYALLLSTTKGNVDLLSELPVDSPVFLWKMVERIGDFFGATNQVEVVLNACIPGVSALIVAKRRIEPGRYKRVIMAGRDILSHFITSGFLSFRSVSIHLCRPYDMQRDRLSLDEACGAVLLETQGNMNHIILSRGAINNDVDHVSGPSRTGDGLALVINQAMEKVGALPGDVNFIDAHGTVTAYNGEMESKAVHLAGLAAAPVNSLESYLGHILGASSIIETMLCMEQLKERKYYEALGYETLGAPMSIIVYVTHQPIPIKHCVKTASGFGGCNAALVLSLPDAYLGQKVNSQATDRASTPPVCKAVVGSGSVVTIGLGAVESKGTTVFSSSEADFAPFIQEAHKYLEESNMKFYKTDSFCKLGYAAAEYLLEDTSYHLKEIGIILANASPSLSVDYKHQTTISKERDEATNSTVSVYILPNIVLREICIRHKTQGENTFFVRRQSDAASLEDYAGIVMAKSKLRVCIIG